MAYSASEMATLAKGAGFDSATAKIMGAIGMAESSGNPQAHNTNASTGDNSYGLWQINMIDPYGSGRRKSFGISSNDQLFSPTVNAHAAYVIYKQQGLRAWSTYKNNDYKKYLSSSGTASSGLGTGYTQADYKSYSANGRTVDLTKAPAGQTQAAWNDLLRVFPPYEIYKLFQGDAVPDVLENSVPGLSAVDAIASSIGKGASWISTPSNWLRVLYVVGGAAVLIAGIAYIGKGTAIQAIGGDIIKTVKPLAKSAKRG